MIVEWQFVLGVGVVIGELLGIGSYKLGEELAEWVKTENPSELIDIANICMMLYYRMNN